MGPIFLPIPLLGAFSLALRTKPSGGGVFAGPGSQARGGTALARAQLIFPGTGSGNQPLWLWTLRCKSTGVMHERAARTGNHAGKHAGGSRFFPRGSAAARAQPVFHLCDAVPEIALFIAAGILSQPQREPRPRG